MVSDSVLRAMVEQLNERCFRDIWNEVTAEERTNVRLIPQGTRFCSGTVTVGLNTIPLPDVGMYGVYLAPLNLFFSALPLVADRWYSGNDVLGTVGTLLMVYPPSGTLLPRNQIFVRKLGNSNRLLVALSRNAMAKVFSATYRDPLYLTTYRDSDPVNPITVANRLIPATNTSLHVTAAHQMIADAQAINADGTTVLINGIEIDPAKTFTLVAGDYIEVVCDRNVVGTYTINVSTNTTAFFSSKDNRYKEILHCPKAKNPDQKVITHNTCTLFVRSNTTNKGLYLHRTEPYCVSQVTHTDLAVDRGVVEALRDALGDENVSVHVLMRVHSKDNILVDEASFLRYLYTLDDATILTHLRGLGDPSLSFWSADQLEKSGYVAMMFDTPNTTTRTTLTGYVNSLGYYPVTSLLASHQSSTTHDGSGYMVLQKPFALTGVETIPFVYLNGRKLRDEQIEYTDVGTDHLAISLNTGIVHPAGSTMAISLTEGGGVRPTIVIPTIDHPTVTIAATGVVVYEEVTLDTPVAGYKTTKSVAYARIQEQPGTLLVSTTGGSTTVTFGQSLYGKTLLVQRASYMYAQTRDVDAILATGEALIFPLQIACVNDITKVVPLLGTPTVEVYVNGCRLTDNVDYTAIPYDTEDGRVYYDVVLSAMSYFDYQASGNKLEIVAYTSATLASESGFCVANKVSYDKNLNLWYDGLSRVFIGGLLVHRPEIKGSWLEPTAPVDNGTPYVLHTTLPHGAAALLDGYTSETDVARQSAINRYFNRNPPSDPTTIVVAHSYRLYSPYMTVIITDILNGDLEVVDDPIDRRFLEQFAAYDYLKERDPVLIKTGPVDFDYVDATAQYKVSDVSDMTQYRIIQRLTRLVMPIDTHTTGDYNQ